MRIVQSWLKDYLRYSLKPDIVADRLGKLGLEVASVEDLGARYAGFVVGEVVSCERHPNADRLTVCRVNVGREEVQVVCGAPNVAAGQKVAVGLVGATVPRNQHDPGGEPFVLQQVSIRGVESRGMICSEFELGLGDDVDRIMILPTDAPAGRPLAKEFGLDDIAFDIEVTPNRPDWLNHIGVAREIGVILKKKPSLPRVALKEGKTPISKFLRIKVEDRHNCPRFAARMIRGVRVGPSPAWLQQRLSKAGLRPINNIVDVTNYVMYECGHPLHAFDHALLEQGTIVVRQATAGSRFRTLDGKEHTLPEGAVMVCDGTKEISIAGVMGGANSEIRETTTDIVLEAAYWNPSSIRRTSKRLGIVTDASQRFERGADPNGAGFALDRAAELVVRLAGGEILKGTIDIYPKKTKSRRIPCRVNRVNSILGTQLTKREVVALLGSLDISCTAGKSDLISCSVPTYRVDVEREIDLIEEVARVYGYDRIESKSVTAIDLSRPFPGTSLAESIRANLVGAGFAECLCSSMQDEQRARLGGSDPVRLRNPLGLEMAFLRTSLIPGLLDTVKRNQNHGNVDLRLFEIGHVFKLAQGSTGEPVEGFVEEERVALLLSGEITPPHWSRAARKSDFFDVKGEVAALVDRLSLDKTRFISYSTSDGLNEASLSIEIHGSYAGFIGQVRREVLEQFGVESEVFVAELNLSMLSRRDAKQYRQLPRFPKVERDISIFVDREVPVGRIEESIRAAGSELLSDVRLFDVYEGDRAPQGQKSLAFTLTMMSRERTLTDPEIERGVRDVVQTLEREFNATLRSVKEGASHQ